MTSHDHKPGHDEAAEARLTAYALGELPLDEQLAVEAALKAAEGEQAESMQRSVEEYRRLAACLTETARRDRLPPPSSSLRRAVEQRLAESEPLPSPVRSRPRVRRYALAVAVVACVGLAAVTLALLPGFRPARQGADNRAVAMADADRSADQRGRELAEMPQASGTGDRDSVAEKAFAADKRLLLRQNLAGAPVDAAPSSGSTSLESLGEMPAISQQTVITDRASSSGLAASPPVVLHDRLAVTASQPESKSARQRHAGRSMDVVPTAPAASPYSAEHLEFKPGKARSFGAGYPAEIRREGNAGGSAPTPATLPAGLGGMGMEAAVEGIPASAGAPRPTAPLPGSDAMMGGMGAPYSVTGPWGGAAATVPMAPSEPGANYGVPLRAYTSNGKQPLGEKLAESEAPAWAGVGGYFHPGPAPTAEQYATIIENDFVDVNVQPLSTVAIDVDTASYANVRRYLNSGRLPPADAVRVEEMVNYFRYDYPAPQGNQPFSVDAEVTQCPWNVGHRLVRIGLKGREVEKDRRGPTNLVFLLDVSGSMNEPNKLPLVKEAMRMLVEQLTEDDRVAIVTYAGDAGLRLPSTNATSQGKILDAIQSLSAGGSTHGSAGIQLAYEQASEHFIPEGTNRVILATDGDLNVGITDDDSLVRLIQQKAAGGVFLTVLGFGTGNLKDGKLEKIADKGNGVYAYVDSMREARRVLVEQISGSLVTIAKDVKVQLEFNPAEVASYRLIGYENRVLGAADFHDDRKDAGDVGAGHTATALYEIVLTSSAESAKVVGDSLRYQRARHELSEAAGSGELLTVKLRYKEPDGEKSQLLEFPVKDSGARFSMASDDFRFAASVAAFGMVLRNSQHAGEATLAAIEEYTAGALGEDARGDRAEFLDLIRRTRQLTSPRE